MIRRTPGYTRTDTLFPYSPLCRSCSSSFHQCIKQQMHSRLSIRTLSCNTACPVPLGDRAEKKARAVGIPNNRDVGSGPQKIGKWLDRRPVMTDHNCPICPAGACASAVQIAYDCLGPVERIHVRAQELGRAS